MSHAPIPNGADPLDLLGTDTLLNDEERLLRDTVRKFVADKVLPDVGEWFDAGTFPKEMAKEFGALGVLGMHLDGASEERVIVTIGAAHPVEEMIDLGQQGFEQRLRGDLNERQQGAEWRRGGLPVRDRKNGHQGFALPTAIIKHDDLLLNETRDP
jgi:hypothetical protein